MDKIFDYVMMEKTENYLNKRYECIVNACKQLSFTLT